MTGNRITMLPVEQARTLIQAMNAYQAEGRPRFPRAYAAYAAYGLGICWCPYGCQHTCGDRRPTATHVSSGYTIPTGEGTS